MLYCTYVNIILSTIYIIAVVIVNTYYIESSSIHYMLKNIFIIYKVQGCAHSGRQQSPLR